MSSPFSLCLGCIRCCMFAHCTLPPYCIQLRSAATCIYNLQLYNTLSSFLMPLTWGIPRNQHNLGPFGLVPPGSWILMSLGLRSKVKGLIPALLAKQASRDPFSVTWQDLSLVMCQARFRPCDGSRDRTCHSLTVQPAPPYTKNENPRKDYSGSRSRGCRDVIWKVIHL